MISSGKRVLFGAVASLSSLIVSLLISMILMPIIVESLGDRLFGAWIMVGTFLGYYGLLDLGISKAVSRFVSRMLGQENQAEANAYFTTSLYILFCAALCILIITIVIALCAHLITSSPEESVLFQRVIFVTGISLAISFPSRSFQGVLMAHLRHDIIGICDTIIALLRGALILSIFSAGGKLLSLAIINGGLYVVRGLVLLLACKINASINLQFSGGSFKKAKEMLDFGMASFFSQIADLIRFRAYPVIIPIFMSLGMVTPYAISFRLKTLIEKVSISVLDSFFPIFSRQEGEGGEKTVVRMYFLTYKISCYLGALLVGLLFVCGGNFIERWMGPEYGKSVLYLNILAIGSFFAIIQIPTIHFLFVSSRHHFFAISNGIECTLNLILTLILIQIYGLVGVALGMAIPMILIKVFLQPWWVCRVFKISLFHYHVRYTLINILIPAVFILSVYVVSQSFLSSNYIVLTLVGGLSTLLFCPYIFLTGFTSKEKKMLLRSVLPDKIFSWIYT